MTQYRDAALACRYLWAAVLCAWLPACTSPADEPSGEPGPPPAVEVPAAPAPSTEAYISASHEACDLYLGGLFSMAQADEQLDTAALVGESVRIEDAIAAVQTDLGIRPCGR